MTQLKAMKEFIKHLFNKKENIVLNICFTVLKISNGIVVVDVTAVDATTREEFIEMQNFFLTVGNSITVDVDIPMKIVFTTNT